VFHDSERRRRQGHALRFGAMTRLKTFAAVFAVAFTLAFAAQGDSAKPTDAAPGAKPGEACKANSDCDQTEHTQRCVKNKCQVQPGDKAPLPRPTT
jgi:hypothetical protein